MLVRQESTSTQEERVRNVEQGLELAKEAVEMDATDPESWMVLGNAYLAAFFSIQQNPRTLKLAMTAYKRAVSHSYMNPPRISVLAASFFFISSILSLKCKVPHL